MGAFNLDILEKQQSLKKTNNISSILWTHSILKSLFYASTTKASSQLYHIWSNVPKINCKSGVIEACWLYITNHSILDLNSQILL